MLRRYWFKTARGLGYGVTAMSVQDARALLEHYGYPRRDEEIIDVIEDVGLDALDASHVLPNAGPVVIRGVWYPRHNILNRRMGGVKRFSTAKPVYLSSPSTISCEG